MCFLQISDNMPRQQQIRYQNSANDWQEVLLHVNVFDDYVDNLDVNIERLQNLATEYRRRYRNNFGATFIDCEAAKWCMFNQTLIIILNNSRRGWPERRTNILLYATEEEVQQTIVADAFAAIQRLPYCENGLRNFYGYIQRRFCDWIKMKYGDNPNIRFQDKTPEYVFARVFHAMLRAQPNEHLMTVIEQAVNNAGCALRGTDRDFVEDYKNELARRFYLWFRMSIMFGLRRPSQ